MDKEELIYELAKKMGLSKYEHEMFLHDVNNLRGSEWLDQVQDLSDEELLKNFKEVAGIVEDYGDEYEYEEI